jgi:hypothetical protein
VVRRGNLVTPADAAAVPAPTRPEPAQEPVAPPAEDLKRAVLDELKQWLAEELKPLREARGDGLQMVRYRLFQSPLSSWDSLLGQAAEFASRLGPGRLIGISQSEDGNSGTAAVWYWAEVDESKWRQES